MKVTVEEKETKSEIKFPILMEGTDSDGPYIVLMLGWTEYESTMSGVVLMDETKNHYPAGHLSKHWAVEYFKPFNGKITLEN